MQSSIFPLKAKNKKMKAEPRDDVSIATTTGSQGRLRRPDYHKSKVTTLILIFWPKHLLTPPPPSSHPLYPATHITLSTEK